MAKLKAPKGKFLVKLRGVGNPDFSQYADVANPKTATGKTLGEISTAARNYIGEWNLGGGNWPVTRVFDSTGKVIAEISYNGRAWAPGPSVVGKASLLAPETKPFDAK